MSGSPLRRHIQVLGGYLALALALTWPTAANFASAIPGDGFDGLQNYWNLWWVRRALLDPADLARALAAVGQMEEAETDLRGALASAGSQGAYTLLWRMHADLGSVYRAKGQRDDAEHEFASARIIIQDLANNIPTGELHENFLKQASATMPAAPALTPLQIAKKEFGGLTAREREIAALVARVKSRDCGRTCH